jgi:hypothetical protein
MITIPTQFILRLAAALLRGQWGEQELYGAQNFHLWHVQSGLQKVQLYFPNLRMGIENYRNCSCAQQERTTFKINFALATGQLSVKFVSMNVMYNIWDGLQLKSLTTR